MVALKISVSHKPPLVFKAFSKVEFKVMVCWTGEARAGIAPSLLVPENFHRS